MPSISTEQAVIVAPYTAPTVITSDSPPYTPTGPQSTPTNDDQFTATYTYTQYPLPSVNATGTAPITTGIAIASSYTTAPCLVQTGSTAQFVRHWMFYKHARVQRLTTF